MSSFKGIAKIDGKERNLLRAEYTLYKLRDITGNPTTSTRKTPIQLMFESTGFDDDLYYYMFSANASFSGELLFYDRDGLKTLYKVEFHNAYIIGLTEEFNHEDNLPLHIKLSITCGAVKIKGVKKLENWVFNDPFVNIKETKLERKEEPHLIDFYYVDTENNREPKLTYGDEIYLIVESQGMIGDTVDLKLNDKTLDFTYKGNRLKNDTIEDYKIRTNRDKISLTVIEEDNEELE